MEPLNVRYLPASCALKRHQSYLLYVGFQGKFNRSSGCRCGPTAPRRHRQLPQHRVQGGAGRKLPVSEEGHDQRHPRRPQVSERLLRGSQVSRIERDSHSFRSLATHSRHTSNLSRQKKKKSLPRWFPSTVSTTPDKMSLQGSLSR